jgi:hypothetical protein
MTNELTKFLDTDNLPAVDGGALANALTEAADDATTGGGGANVDYLSFSGKTGKYSLGREQADIDPDQLYLVEPKTFIGGWVCWKDSKPIDRIEWSVYKAKEQAVDIDDLEDHGPYRESAGEGWQQLLGLGLIGCDAVQSQVKFSSTSKSGRNSIGDLMKEIAVRALAEEPSLPLIYFDSVTFEAQGNKNYKPVMQVDTWVTRASAAAYLAGDLSEDQLLAGDKPKKRGRKKK